MRQGIAQLPGHFQHGGKPVEHTIEVDGQAVELVNFTPGFHAIIQLPGTDLFKHNIELSHMPVQQPDHQQAEDDGYGHGQLQVFKKRPWQRLLDFVDIPHVVTHEQPRSIRIAAAMYIERQGFIVVVVRDNNFSPPLLQGRKFFDLREIPRQTCWRPQAYIQIRVTGIAQNGIDQVIGVGGAIAFDVFSEFFGVSSDDQHEIAICCAQ